MGHYTQQRELCQFETIFSWDYTCAVEQIFQHYFYICLARFTSLKIDSAAVRLSFAVSMVRFCNVNADKLTSVQWVFFMSSMRCYVHNVLSILLSSPARTIFQQCCLVRYSPLAIGLSTIPHQTTLWERKQFPQEKTIIKQYQQSRFPIIIMNLKLSNSMQRKNCMEIG